MHLLLTRPIEEAQASATRLEGMGHRVTLAPMLEVVVDRQVSIDPAGIAAIAVTSPRAVRALALRDDFAQLSALPLLAVGDRTAQLAREAGFEHVESAAGDVAALAILVGDQVDPAQGAVLYACGRDRHGDLEGRLAAAGFDAQLREVYRAEAIHVLNEAAHKGLMDGQIDAVLIYSARTAAAFLDAVMQAGLHSVLARLTILAISPAAAEPFAGADVKRIMVAKRPDESALLDCVVMLR